MADCKNCGMWIEGDGFRTKRFDAQFCSDECRTEYHNQSRKLKRKYDAVLSAMDELFKCAVAGEALEHEAINHLMQIKEAIDRSWWTCGKCGLGHAGVPYETEVCDDCQSTAWEIRKHYKPF